MDISEDFRRRAARCIERSRMPKSELAKATWLDMAQFWLSLARQAERTGDRGDGNHDRGGDHGDDDHGDADDQSAEPSPAFGAAGDGYRTNRRANGSGDRQDRAEQYGPGMPSNRGQQHNGGGQRVVPRH
jgi:hypothetical protein